MAENLAFTLRLVDEVSQTAAKVASSLRGVKDGAGKAGRALDFSDQLKRVQGDLSRLKLDPKGYRDLIKAQKELAEQRKKIKDGLHQEGFFSSFTKALPFRTVAQYTQAAAVGELMAEGFMKAGEILLEAGKKLVEVVTEGFKKAIEAGSKYEVLRLGERMSLGKGAKDFVGDIGRFAGKTGLDDDEIRRMLLPLRRAGFSQAAARTAFAGASDIAVGLGKGGDKATIEAVLDTLTKAQLKEGITAKQLVGLGIAPKEVYADLAKRTGQSTESVEKQVDAGKFKDPQGLINAILRGVERRQGSQLGTATEEYGKTMQAKLHMLGQLGENYLKQVSESPAWMKLSDSLGNLLEKLSPESPAGQRILKKLNEMFDQIAGWLSYLGTDEGTDSLIKALENVLGIVQKIVNAIQTVGQSISDIKKGDTVLPGAGIANAVTQGANSPMLQGSSFIDDFAPGLGAAKAYAAKSRATTVAPVINVKVEGGKDAEETGRKVGRAAGQETARHLERAANEAGAQ